MNFEELEKIIQAAYEEGVTLDEAEKLAGRFLHAQLKVAEELRVADLDARMRKTGLKALKAALYLEEVKKNEKKPSDTLLQHTVDANELTQNEQNSFDAAEVERDRLQNYLNVFKEAHVYFRGIAKGRFE